ncbi:MAG: uroporphyrinogen-III synthase [Bacteroidota bacterium]
MTTTMADSSQAPEQEYRSIRTILVSQPEPERNPYEDLAKRYNLTIDWRPFIEVQGLTAKEFRKQRVYPNEFSSVIFTSKTAIDHFFRLCKEMRIDMSGDTRYYCLTEAIANYLQKFIVYRKRKVAVGKRTIDDLANTLKKYRSKETFFLPCSNLGAKKVTNFLNENDFNWKEGMMYQTVSSDLSDLENVFYDVLVFFSPLGIKSLFENFPDFKQNNTRLAVAGSQTTKAVEERGLRVDIAVKPPEVPSMTSALKAYLKLSNPQ